MTRPKICRKDSSLLKVLIAGIETKLQQLSVYRLPDKFGKAKSVLVFGAAICGAAKTSIRTAIKEVLRTQWGAQRLEWFAEKLNPKIRGWIN